MMSRSRPLADSARCGLQPNGGAGMIRAHLIDGLLVLTQDGMIVGRCANTEQGAEGLSDETLRRVARAHVQGRADMAAGRKLYRPVILHR